MKKYILNKTEEILSQTENLEYESISVRDFLVEFDYATKYLPRFLKVRSFAIYMLLFKRAYYSIGSRKIKLKISALGQNMLSNFGNPMSKDVVKRGIKDLVDIGLIEKLHRPGKINEYIVKLPSEITAIKKLISKEDTIEESIYGDSEDDILNDPEKRIEILKRDNYKCFYCLCELREKDFYLNHIEPKAKGGHDWKSNLVSSCRTCNMVKNSDNVDAVLLGNSRKGLILKSEYLEQKKKLEKLKAENQKIKENIGNIP
jgi:Zn-finger protein